MRCELVNVSKLIDCRNINEDKRKAEGHQVMFEIVNDIENCPVSIHMISCLITISQFHVLSLDVAPFTPPPPPPLFYRERLSDKFMKWIRK